MTKVFTRSEWIGFLKRDLIPYPGQKNEHEDEYITPEYLVLTIFTKGRKYTCGGPIYTAIIKLYDNKEIMIEFPLPMFLDGRGKKPYKIKWEKIKGMSFSYMNTK